MTGEVTVVGLGKIGLPLAVQIAGKGFRVHGADRNPDVIHLVAQGSPPFPGEPGLAERLQAAVGAGTLVPTSDTARAVAHSDVVIIVVPLVTDSAGSPVRVVEVRITSPLPLAGLFGIGPQILRVQGDAVQELP